jgi:hypothetical protein
MSGSTVARRLRQETGKVRLAALTGCIPGCGAHTWRQGQQGVKQDGA